MLEEGGNATNVNHIEAAIVVNFKSSDKFQSPDYKLTSDMIG
jgi:hypothetical protein